MPSSTIAIPSGIDQSRRGHWLRLLFVAILLVTIVVALMGWFGVRSRTVRAQSPGYDVALEFAAISRRGITTPWRITVAADRGFSDDVVVSVPVSYLSRVSIRGMQPEPSESTTAGDTVLWTFSSPPGTTFTLELDAEIDPSATPGRAAATTRVRVGDHTIARFHYRTWIWP